MEHNYYMVRAMFSREDDFIEFFENNIVAVGWSEIDFSNTNIDELGQVIFEEYYKDSGKRRNVISKGINEALRFKGIKKGDYIIVPYHSNIVLAVAEDKEIYSPNSAKLDLANQRAVSYKYEGNDILTVPRKELSEGLQRRLRVMGSSVTNLADFKEEIDKIFEIPSYTHSYIVSTKEEDALSVFKKDLLRNIQQGKTHLEAGGNGLENLVQEIMECEGYKATVLAKTKFSGNADADVLAVKEDSFMTKKIFVQVKHHNGITNEHGVKQLIEVLNENEYTDYDGYLITSGFVTDTVKQLAMDNEIEIIDGNSLIDLIVLHLPKLKSETKRKLGICAIPYLI